jgi:tRNA pseudouridine55 synthase
MDGILLVLKPPGMTSFDVIAWLRGITGIKKIGHAGTLDPAAVGLLPVCIGKATKTIGWLQDFDKSYRAGIITNTQDQEGEILQRNKVELDKGELLQTFDLFIGEYEQLPPMHSAIKVNGKRLYELARQGVELHRKKRKVHISKLTLIDAKLDRENPVVLFDVSCSKGTYIRTLCADIGQKIGCGAYMSFLIRTGVGPFSIEKALTLEEIKRASEEGNLSSALLPVDIVFQKYPGVSLSSKDLLRFTNGAPVELMQEDVNLGDGTAEPLKQEDVNLEDGTAVPLKNENESDAPFDAPQLKIANNRPKTEEPDPCFVRVYSESDSFIGLGKIHGQKSKIILRAHKLFATNQS